MVWSITAKFYVELRLEEEHEFIKKYFGYMTNMAAMPIFNKNL